VEPSRNKLFEQVAAEIGHSFDGEIVVGGKYVSTIEHEDEIYISGQIPRVGSTVAVTGRVGAETSLEQGKLAATICAMRALALLRQALGDLSRVKKILRITVYVQSAPDFTQQREVADLPAFTPGPRSVSCSCQRMPPSSST
jgi:enamine deaminase RidA (YjgF/YER057c/UK114 family)